MDLKVDIDELLRERAPRYYRWIPRVLIRAMERYVCQDRLNRILQVTAGLTGSDFAAGVLSELGVSYSVESGVENMPARENRRVTYVCNHPLGGLDGICLIDWVAKYHGVEPAFVVNDLLTVVTPLNNIFVPINKHGRQSRGAVADVDDAFANLERPVIMFPAGLCSRQVRKGAEICDLKWNKMFVQKSAEAGRAVVPLRFIGQNSPEFYRFARRRERCGMKFNLEMLRLPRELILGEGSHYGLRIGRQIAPDDLNRGHGAVAQAQEIRNHIYTL